MNLPRIELPVFGGDNPRGWIRKCRKYFKMHNELPVQQWVEVASMYLEGKSEIWFEGILLGNNDLTNWKELAKALCMRFGSHSDVVEEFNKLEQEKGTDEYIERLKSLMKTLNPMLPESYYVSSFISGLKEEIKLKILKPTTLIQAFDQAKWHEKSIVAVVRRNIIAPRISSSFNNERSAGITPYKPFNQHGVDEQSSPKQSTNTLYEQRRKLGLCFKYDDKFVPGHKCSVKGIHLIEGREDEKEKFLETEVKEQGCCYGIG